MSREIRVALFSFGWDSIGTGARLVLLAFARSPEIRAAVRKQLGMMAPEER